jgi:hypothetical protein
LGKYVRKEITGGRKGEGLYLCVESSFKSNKARYIDEIIIHSNTDLLWTTIVFFSIF